jgi:hypothetical protein
MAWRTSPRLQSPPWTSTRRPRRPSGLRPSLAPDIRRVVRPRARRTRIPQCQRRHNARTLHCRGLRQLLGTKRKRVQSAASRVEGKGGEEEEEEPGCARA